MNKTGLFIFVSIIAVSCLNEPDCYQLNNSVVVVFFKIIGGGSDVAQNITVQSPETDSIFYSNESESSINLALNPKTEETLYTIVSPEGTNTLHFGYERQAQFVSEACGERFYYQNLKVLEHNYDSVRVVNAIPSPWPLPTGAKNVDIYRCAVTNQMGISFATETFVQKITSDHPDYPTIALPSDGMLKDFVLPLNPNDTTTEFTFVFSAGSKKLRVRYARTDKEFAEICGLQRFYHDLHINSLVTNLTKAEVSKDSIQDLPVINLEVTP
jgi:hypothetical protein